MERQWRTCLYKNAVGLLKWLLDLWHNFSNRQTSILRCEHDNSDLLRRALELSLLIPGKSNLKLRMPVFLCAAGSEIVLSPLVV